MSAGLFSNSQRTSVPNVAIQRVQLSPTEHFKYAYSASASVHPKIQFPQGASLIGFTWASHSTSVTFRFQGMISTTGPYRFVRKSDDSAQLRIFNTSATSPGYMYLPDLAPFAGARVILNKKMGSRRVYQFIFKG